MYKNTTDRPAARQIDALSFLAATTWAPLNREELVLVRHGLLRVGDNQAVSVWTARRLLATLDASAVRGSVGDDI
jgi:hypothetical protein